MGDSDEKKDASEERMSHSAALDKASATPHGVDINTLASQADLLEVARDFLRDEAIKSEPRSRKVEFLKEKGIKSEDIEKLLDEESRIETSNQTPEEELKTVHDSTTHVVERETPIPPSQPSAVPVQSSSPLREAPPIITYPEFLLKPQKPPPLVTISRLLNAGYALAGLSAMVYGANKYLVEPMVQNLTEARHDLASTTLEDLKKFNTKLESSVSHVPYTASAALKAQHAHDDEDDASSIDSDPTELFHRDMATQTSPHVSPTLSSSTLNKPTSLDATTTTQTARLKSLHTTLETLVSSLNPNPGPFMPPTSTKKLHDTVSSFQSLLDKLESTYNPFRTDFSSSYPALSGSVSSSKLGAGRADNNEAAKFKAEIRALKGAFLSSRNFPAARPQNFMSYSPGH